MQEIAGPVLGDLEQGGEIPVHFITLTTAIYHWADLGKILREYEESTTECRGGRQDPLEPGEEQVAAEKNVGCSIIQAWLRGIVL